MNEENERWRGWMIFMKWFIGKDTQRDSGYLSLSPYGQCHFTSWHSGGNQGKMKKVV